MNPTINENLRIAYNAVQRNDLSTAWKYLNDELNERPDRPEACYMMGHVLRLMKNPGLALPVLAKALSKDPDKSSIWMNYGACLHDLNRWDEAIQAFMVVLKKKPNDVMAMANMAGSLVNLGRWRDTITWADRALEIAPDNHIAQIAKTFACLGLGRWSDAWKHAEYLYGQHLNVRIYQDEGEWDGSHGKTVVVQCDQGVGDIIMFSQCIPMLQKVSKEVIMETAPRMVPLFKRNFPGVHVYGTLKENAVDWLDRHQIDAHIHISYLPKFFMDKDSEFPRKAYLKPCPRMTKKWVEGTLHKYPKPWIGIAWQGGIQNTHKANRSFNLAEYAPLLNGVKGTFFDLSYHDSDLEVALWNVNNPGVQIVNPQINEDNFDATFALVGLMDEVVTVTTTVAHVCGSMGRTARVLVPEVPQWRYAYRFGDGTEMVWYPEKSVHLYRRKPGEKDWSHAINRVVNDLKCSTSKS